MRTSAPEEEAASRLDRIEHRTERLEELRPPSPSCASNGRRRAGSDQSAPDSAPRLAASIVRHSREQDSARPSLK
ncbi:MAG: hypothetical protein ACLT38_08095 [Akkermansia sp.]